VQIYRLLYNEWRGRLFAHSVEYGNCTTFLICSFDTVRFSVSQAFFEEEINKERGFYLKKVLFALLGVSFILQTTGVYASQQEPFSDVPDTHWAKNAIVAMKDLGVIDGIGEGLYAPDQTATKAQFIKMLIASGYQTGGLAKRSQASTAPYQDVHPADWYYLFVVEAFKNSILKFSDTLEPNKVLLREEMASILVKYYNAVSPTKISLDEGNRDVNPYYTDIQDVSAESRASILALDRLNLIEGNVNSDGEIIFDPKGILTRAEAATITQRISEKMKEMNTFHQGGVSFQIEQRGTDVKITASLDPLPEAKHSVKIRSASKDDNGLIRVLYLVTSETSSPGIPEDAFTLKVDDGKTYRYEFIAE
jgi:hypothetical protein